MYGFLAGFLWAEEGAEVWLVIFVKGVSGTMAPTWFCHRGPGVGRVRVLRLLHRGSVAGSNLKVGWAPVRNLLWCCLGAQPSVGVGTALACRGREHMVNTRSPLPARGSQGTLFSFFPRSKK